jgi:hypothetical protein
MDKNLETFVHLLARQAAKIYLQNPELVNAYYSMPKLTRPALLKKAREISRKKS